MIARHSFQSSEPLPSKIQAYVSIRSAGGKSCFSEDQTYLPNSAAPYYAAAKDKKNAIHVVERMGFSIQAESDLGLAIVGPPGALEELTGGKLITVEVFTQAEFGIRRYVTHIDVVGNQPHTIGQGRIRDDNTSLEGLLIERPAATSQAIYPTPIPPSVAKYHLRVPDDVAVGLNAVYAHRAGFRGANVSVAMVDSGHYAHPFFHAHGYNVLRPISVVADAAPDEDPLGHGTGESANIFAVAPDAILQPIRASNKDGHLVGPIAGLLKAKELRPQIITNSWGKPETYPPTSPLQPAQIAWALEIVDAVEKGICVVFSAGNGTFALEAQIPAIISAGGAFMHKDMDFRASDYASGYPSPWFVGRNVPDVAGLVGMLPRAQYIMLPVPPNSFMDQFSSVPIPGDADTDRTLPYDGWTLTSGTSAAAPQIAGAAAVLLGAAPHLTPAQVKEALMRTARDVKTGRCHPTFNFPAGVGPDLATGHGVVDVDAAVRYAIALPGNTQGIKKQIKR
jgi:subtilisin family serine protease